MENNFNITSASVSDRGLSEKRPENEDSFLVLEERGVYAVADGVGGAQAGDVASQMAVEILGEAFINQSSEPDAEDIMRMAIERANSAIYQMANDLPQLSSMATTVVALHVQGNIATIGHVGDSRLYVLCDGELEQVTHDDSWAATILAQDPKIGPADIAHHPLRHVLTNVLGAREHVEIHLTERDLKGGEIMLLCSDGLHGVMDGDAVRDVLLSTPDLEGAARELVETAMERGSRDNVTALLVRYEADI